MAQLQLSKNPTIGAVMRHIFAPKTGVGQRIGSTFRQRSDILPASALYVSTVRRDRVGTTSVLGMMTRIRIPSTDGYMLGGYVWRQAGDPQRPHPVVIINAATSVRCRYYASFANYLHSQGFDVLTYDYRGIGESRQGSLRGFCADWIDWSALDFEGVLRYAQRHFPGQPIDVVGHSVGGLVIGMAASAHRVRRIFTMGAQFAFWRDYATWARKRMYWQWHVVMPLLVRLFGYVPAKRLGWMEDTPKGVALNWSQMGPRFELTLCRRRSVSNGVPGPSDLVRRFAGVTAPILALGMEDDPFGTAPAIDRLLDYYVGSDRHHLRLAPEAIGEPAIGHFAFFNERFREKLWPIALEWLRAEHLPTQCAGTLTHRSAENLSETRSQARTAERPPPCPGNPSSDRRQTTS